MDRRIAGIESGRLQKIDQRALGIAPGQERRAAGPANQRVSGSQADCPIQEAAGGGSVTGGQRRFAGLPQQIGVGGIVLERVFEVPQSRRRITFLQQLQGPHPVVRSGRPPLGGFALLPLQSSRLPQSILREPRLPGCGVGPGQLEQRRQMRRISLHRSLENDHRAVRIAAQALDDAENPQRFRVLRRPVRPRAGVGSGPVEVAETQADSGAEGAGLHLVGGAGHYPVQLLSGVGVAGFEKGYPGQAAGGDQVVGPGFEHLKEGLLGLGVASGPQRRLAQKEGVVGLARSGVLLQEVRGFPGLTLPEEGGRPGPDVLRPTGGAGNRAPAVGIAPGRARAGQRQESQDHGSGDTVQAERAAPHARIIARRPGKANRLALERFASGARMTRVMDARGSAARWAVVLFLPVVSPEGAGGAPALSALVSRLESFYRNSPGITARFVQVLDSRTLTRPQEETGKVFLRPPGRMRWEYENPPGKLAVTDGARTFLYLPEDRQVLVGKVSNLDHGAIASRLLLGTSPLEADFRVDGEPAPGAGDRWLLRLSPRTRDFPYDAVMLEVAAETGAIRSIRLHDPLGNRIEYRFDRIRVIRDLPERLFTYRIPRGVDVQRLDGAEDDGSSSP